MSRPFLLVPWSEDFLPRVADVVAERSGGRPGRAVVVFPHSRPRRYLTDLYRSRGDLPLLLPRMMTGQDLIARCREAWAGEEILPRRASRLDQVALLKRALERLAGHLAPDHPLAAILRDDEAKSGGMARFFPWGVRLAALMEECFNQLAEPRDILYADDQVQPFAAALLENLSAIREYYLEELDAAALSTPGRDAALAAAAAAGREAGVAPASPVLGLPHFLQGRSLILAGFVRLTRAENALYHHLWRQGATVLLHSDPALLEGRGHWSTLDHAQWLKRWKAPCELLGKDSGRKPALHFFAGYDLHSQLAEMERELARSEHETCSQAVVLPSSALLMPALHHVPRKNINISLGYPLQHSLLARLLESVFQAREGLRPDGRVHWRALLRLMRHPYVRMLGDSPADFTSAAVSAAGATNGQGVEDKSLHSVSDVKGSKPSLRLLLRLMERKLRSGARLVRPDLLLRDLLDETLGDPDGDSRHGSREESLQVTEADAALLERCFRVLLDDWADLTTLRRLARNLGALCDLLLSRGGSLWQAFPIDAECLMRLMQSLIPGLEDNCLADETLPPATLLAIARQALAEERVPFEADPLTGLQVLGMLETRLLRFDRLFLLDLTEDNLPGSPAQDPLLPDSLRGLLGLPDAHERDRLAAHTFRRLLAGARHVWLFWQEGVEQYGLMDAKKLPSRFVEEAVWDLEKREKKRLTPGEGPLRGAVFPLAVPPLRKKRAIPNTGAVAGRMDRLLSRPVSPTLLDGYLRCPARFFYEHACRIRPLEEVREGDDHSEAGMVLHRVLRRAYEPFLGRAPSPGRPEEGELTRIFAEELDASGLRERLPAESWIMFRESGPKALREYAASRADGELRGLEREISASLSVDGRDRQLFGVLDRVDGRETGEVVLDYKSGRTPRLDSLVWSDDVFWERLEAWQIPAEWGKREESGTPDSSDSPDSPTSPDQGDALFRELRERIPSLQLPCYLFLHHQDSGRPPVNAAWIPLADGGEEEPLFPPGTDAGQAARIVAERIPALLRFVLRHMLHTPFLTPCEGGHCRYCPYSALC